MPSRAVKTIGKQAGNGSTRMLPPTGRTRPRSTVCAQPGRAERLRSRPLNASTSPGGARATAAALSAHGQKCTKSIRTKIDELLAGPFVEAFEAVDCRTPAYGECRLSAADAFRTKVHFAHVTGTPDARFLIEGLGCHLELSVQLNVYRLVVVYRILAQGSLDSAALQPRFARWAIGATDAGWKIGWRDAIELEQRRNQSHRGLLLRLPARGFFGERVPPTLLDNRRRPDDAFVSDRGKTCWRRTPAPRGEWPLIRPGETAGSRPPGPAELPHRNRRARNIASRQARIAATAPSRNAPGSLPPIASRIVRSTASNGPAFVGAGAAVCAAVWIVPPAALVRPR